MSFDSNAIRRAAHDHGPVVRIVVAQVRGSAPREVGASMLVWRDGQSGTIGGGALEHDAVTRARRLSGHRSVLNHSLGPDLGQCCGGSVKLLLERFDVGTLPPQGPFARPLDPGEEDGPPPAVARYVAALAGGDPGGARLIDGWFVEPRSRPRHTLVVWGAGHVGRAVVAVMAPLPDLGILWIDTSPDRFPAERLPQVAYLPTAEPVRAVATAPRDAHHLVMTYSHALDLDICHALLGHGFATCGLIGSETKWARFRSRLKALGHSDAQISGIDCPIGDPALGRDPQAIAIGVAARHLAERDTASHLRPVRTGGG
ncbi:xanthine dehydrogenase accessory protein XdhC [Rhodobacterales bacterium HKCCE3408]|nr:xanthine dehydrogenase accessory protein XdhC [Rhodobacterales bacterium HKCCE3408]